MNHVLANRVHKLVYDQVLVSIKYIRHFLKCYKSEFKNVQAAKSISEKLNRSTDREEASID